MRLLSEVTIEIKKGLFPQFVFDLYKSGCGIQNLDYIQESDKNEKYKLEIVYTNRNSFLEFIDELDKFPENYQVVSVANALEEKVKGGLLSVRGKLPLENMIDYEIGLLGGTEFMRNKISKGLGKDFSGISRSVGMLGCIKIDDEYLSDNLLGFHADTERNSVIISRFTEFNPIPLVIKFDQPDDLMRTIQKIENSFSAIRFINIDESVPISYDQIFSSLSVSASSYMFDDVPLYMLITIAKIVMSNKLNMNDTTIGIIGITVSALRMARLLMKAGYYRVLGYDHNENLMLNFEKNDGLATTTENIFMNADIVLVFKDNFSDKELQQIRPGLYIVSLIEFAKEHIDMVLNSGVRAYIPVDHSNMLVLSPGLLNGLVKSENNYIDDEMIIQISQKLVKLMSENYQLPDIFSEIHENISGCFKN